VDGRSDAASYWRATPASVLANCEWCYEDDKLCLHKLLRFRAEDEQDEEGRPLPLWWVEMKNICIRCEVEVNRLPFNPATPRVAVWKKSAQKKLFSEMKRLDVPNGMIGI
jgi:hypothetical protein